MRTLPLATLAAAASIGLTLSARGNVLVNDTWSDGTRNDPAAPTYAENNGVTGTDVDGDGNIESAWFKGGAGTLTANAGGTMTATGLGTSSASWYTYFTAAATPVTLANAGDQLKLTWVFTPGTVNANNTSQGFNVALALTPSASRVTADASVPSAAYKSYAMFMNMGQTLGNANPFQLRTWSLAGSGALLGTSGNYTSAVNGATSGNHGYDNNTPYTLVMTLTRDSSGTGIDVTSTMTGGALNGTGSASVSYVDAAASQGYSFDTFDIRPSNTASIADTITFNQFEVEFNPVPEPSSLALGGLGLLALALRRMRA